MLVLTIVIDDTTAPQFRLQCMAKNMSKFEEVLGHSLQAHLELWLAEKAKQHGTVLQSFEHDIKPTR